MADLQSTRAISPAVQESIQQASNSQDGAPKGPGGDPNLVSRIIEALGNGPDVKEAPPHTSSGPATLSSAQDQLAVVDERISSLSGRGIVKPVKTKQSLKPTSSPKRQEMQYEDEEPTADQAPPPTKLVKLTLKGAGQLGGPNICAEDRPKRQTSKPSVTDTPKQKSPSKPQPGSLEDVVAGTVLPRTAQEAKTASDVRHSRLLAEHKANVKKRKKGGSSEEPDFMPEFFSVNNFRDGMRTDEVRCACGAIEDDGENMLACDTCNVWQHNKCMGSAVPKNLKKDSYRCHVCDPYAHCELIADLRRSKPLDG